MGRLALAAVLAARTGLAQLQPTCRSGAVECCVRQRAYDRPVAP